MPKIFFRYMIPYLFINTILNYVLYAFNHMTGEETGPMDIISLFTSASSSITAIEGKTHRRHTMMDILLLLPWMLWSRLVVWPMIMSEFQQKMHGAIIFEKQFYKEKDAKEK